MSISEMIEAIEGTLDDTPSKYVIESLVDFLTDDSEWTLRNISNESKKKIMQFANKLGQTEAQHLQDKIDALMLEYCPEEMDADQLREYEAHQVVVDQRNLKLQSKH